MSGEDKVAENGLGNCVRVFRPDPANMLAGLVLAALLLIGGACAVFFSVRGAYEAGWDMPWSAEKGWCWFAVVMGVVIGLGLVGGGLLLALGMRFLWSHRLEICENGFRNCTRRSQESVLWSEVTLIRQTTLYERPPILKGAAGLLVPKLKSTSYTVIASGDKKYEFDGNSVASVKQVGEILRKQAERLALAWEEVEKQG